MPSLRQKLIAACLRRYPLYSGAGTVANSKLIRALAGTSSERVWSPTKGGEVLAALDDYVGKAAFYCGDLDPKISWVCRKLIEPGDVVCDIGANIGIVTLLLSRLVGPSGKVLAFEPNPICYNALVAAVEHNRRSNIVALQLALGAKTDELVLSIPRDNAGAASLRNLHNAESSNSTRVQVRMLDDVLNEQRIDRVKFMKLDVEGFESEVLTGSRRTLEVLRPRAILFEVNDKSAGPLIQLPVFSILDNMGYAFYYLPQDLLRIRPREFNPKETSHLPAHDVLAVSNGDGCERIAQELGALS